jgi:ferrochelatase
MNPTQTPNSELRTPNSSRTPHSSETPKSPDAILIVSFGGPEGMDDVLPFLENVLRGRNVPRERMLAVAKHYEMFGGVSPINEQNRKLIAALGKELEQNGPKLPIYFGNRNWHPLLADALAQMKADGIVRALAFVTSAYSSYSSCRQYLENIAEAREVVGSGAPQVEKIRAFYNHPLFIEANVANIRGALDRIPEPNRKATRLVFTAHSIPMTMAEKCDYHAQLEETANLIAERMYDSEPPFQFKLVYQSRSGPATQSWLGPDVLDYLRESKEAGVSDVVIAPIGFISDHMEVIYDLDTEARQLCESIGLNMVRASTVGTHPQFIQMIRELILERMEPERERRFLGTEGPRADVCAPDCCSLNRET